MLTLLAQAVKPIKPSVFVNDPGDNPTGLFGKVFGAIIAFFLFAAALWAFIQLIMGGIGWISSGGDKGKLEEARHRIQNAVIGILVVFAVWAIYSVVLGFLGINAGGEGEIIFNLPSLFGNP